MCRRILLCFLGACLAHASTITLTGDNTQPGFVSLKVDGTTYQALDYTAQRFASTGDTWSANLVTFSNLNALAYYGPSDPYINFPNVLMVYEEDAYLFDYLLAHPGAAGNVQGAIYFLSGGSGTIDGVDLGSAGVQNLVNQAQGDIASHGTADIPNLNAFYFVDSPFSIGGKEEPANALEQGFVIDGPPAQTPEPGTFFLLGFALLALGWMNRKQSNNKKGVMPLR